METIPTFALWPRIEDLLHNGGLPGVRYCIVPAGNQVRRRAQRLEPVVGTIAQGFRVEHAGVGVDCVLMCEGKPIRGASPESGICELTYDQDLLGMLGLTTDRPPPPDDTVKAPCGASFQDKRGLSSHVRACPQCKEAA